MTTRLLRDRPASTGAMLAVFDDAATLRHALAFEAALAQAQAAVGLIEAVERNRVTQACATITIDPAELAEEAALAGTLAIPLVQRLRMVAGDAVHQGATSQDVADTVLAVQMRDAVALLRPVLDRLIGDLSTLASAEATTPAIGRTLMQDALPIGLGLRIAQWTAGIRDARDRLVREAERGCALQLGGAVGTREGLGGRGAEVAASVAAALGLREPGAPWHARRDGVAGIAAALGILTGALGKMARDIALLSQNAIGEMREPATSGRGGSSAMAHKRNPTGCQIALSAAIRAPGLVATVLTGMPQELERGLGGWQAEASVIADLFALAAGAAEAMAGVAAGLEIDREALAANVAAAGQGRNSGESATLVDRLLAREED